MDELNLFLPLEKVDVLTGEVSGVMAEEAPDHAGEVFDYATGKAAVAEWSEGFAKATGGLSLGNVRRMHGPEAVGKLVRVEYDDQARKIRVVAKVTDPKALNDCREGVLTGFSIGGNYAKKWADPGNPALTRYTPKMAETSLVDNPCMLGARFDVVRAAGVTTYERLEKGVRPVQVVAKDAAAVVTEANAAIDGLKRLVAELALLPGEPDTWALHDVISALSAAIGAKIVGESKVAEAATEAAQGGPETPAGGAPAPAAEPEPMAMAAGTPARDPNDPALAKAAELERAAGIAPKAPAPAAPPAAAEPAHPVLVALSKLTETVDALGLRLAKVEPPQAAAPAANPTGEGQDPLAKAVLGAVEALSGTVATLAAKVDRLSTTERRPGTPVEKMFGTDPETVVGIDVSSIRKSVDALAGAGRLDAMTEQKLRLDLAALEILNPQG